MTGSQNFAARLVRELDAGLCAEPGDRASIEAALERLYLRWQDGKLDISPDVRSETLRRFSRPALARALAAVLESAASSKPS